MITRRRATVAAVTVASAALAVLGVSGNALASNAATSHVKPAVATQIKACYKTSGSLPALDHIATAKACPSGDTSLTWNTRGPQGAQGAQGPQGPAGVAVGTSGTSGTSVVLDQASTLTPVLSATAVPDAGTYYVNASVMLVVAQGDTVACVLGVNGAPTGPFATVGPVSNQTYETLPLNQMMSLSAGNVPTVYCTGYASNVNTLFYDGGITATLINSATGNAKQAAQPRHALPPRIK
jgi:hypothetical protein